MFLFAKTFGILLCVSLLLFLTPFFYRTYLLLNLSQAAKPYTQDGGGGKMLFLGDSTAVGVGADTNKESIPGRFGAIFPKLTIENKAVSGSVIGDVKEQLQGTRDHYDLVILQVGANDVVRLHDTRESAKELRHLLEMLSTKADRIVFLSAGRIGDTPFIQRPFKGYINKRALLAYERYEAVADDFENVLRVSLVQPLLDDAFKNESEVYLARDQFHPSSAGYELWFKEIEEILKKAGIWERLR